MFIFLVEPSAEIQYTFKGFVYGISGWPEWIHVKQSCKLCKLFCIAIKSDMLTKIANMHIDQNSVTLKFRFWYEVRLLEYKIKLHHHMFED